MKKYMLFSLFALIILAGCKKNVYELSDPNRDNFGYGAYLQMISSSTLIDFNTLSTAVIEVKVKEIGGPISKINLYVVEGSGDPDTTNWKLIKAVPGTGGENTLTVTPQEIVDALGKPLSSVNAGDVFTIYTEAVNTKGVKFNINNANADLVGGPAIAAVFSFPGTVFCEYDPTSTDDVEYEVLNDDWADFAVGDLLTVANGPGANQITIKDAYATTIRHHDIVVDIDPANGAATIQTQLNGSYPGWPYSDLSLSGGGFIFSCQGIIDLNIAVDVTVGSFGVNNLRLKKM